MKLSELYLLLLDGFLAQGPSAGRPQESPRHPGRGTVAHDDGSWPTVRLESEGWAGRVGRPAPGIVAALGFDQANLARAWTLPRFLRGELDALAFAKQFEHGASN